MTTAGAVTWDELLEGEELAHVETVPPADAVGAPLPDDLHPGLRKILPFDGLYAHQRDAWDAAARGEHLILATGTASGKSLAFNLPVLDAIAREPKERALYLYPTKALAQDQARALAALRAPNVRAAIYDGDTPGERRWQIRRWANVILTNPDMLHVGVLPHHDRWADVLHNLRYVVVDEAHVYRGVFGSHVGNVLRRLRRLAHVNVGAGRRAAHGSAEGDERQAGLAQPVHHRAAFRGIGMDRDVDRVAMIEAELVVHRRLAVGAHGQRAIERATEVFFERPREPERPRPPALIADEARGDLLGARREPARGRELVVGQRLGDEAGGDDRLVPRLVEARARAGHRALARLEVVARDDAAVDELARAIALFESALDVMLAQHEKPLQARLVVPRRPELLRARARRLRAQLGERRAGRGRRHRRKGSRKDGEQGNRAAAQHDFPPYAVSLTSQNRAN